MFDAVGHGHSFGHREKDGDASNGHTRSQIVWNYNDLVSDIIDFIELRLKRHPKGTRFVLASLSLGGSLAILAGLRLQAKNHPLCLQFGGNFMLAPMIEMPLPSAFIKGLLRCCARCAPTTTRFTPSRKGMGFTVAACKEVMDAEGKDPLCWKKPMPLATLTQFMNMNIEVKRRLAEIDHDFVVYHGDHDARCGPRGSELLVNVSVFGKKCKEDGKQVLFIVPGHRHCLNLEPAGEDLLARLVAYAKEKCAATDVSNGSLRQQAATSAQPTEVAPDEILQPPGVLE